MLQGRAALWRKGSVTVNQERKIREANKEANRLVLSRTVKLMAVFGVLIFIPLIMQLYRLQVVQHDELEERAVEQQTSSLSISASRGTIYDANKNVLAISSTVYDVILSPKAIADKQKELDEQERERKREEKLRRREQKQRDRELRRSQKKLEKLQAEEQRRLQERIRLEERKLLLAQRNLQSIRLVAELLSRAKVREAPPGEPRLQGLPAHGVPHPGKPCPQGLPAYRVLHSTGDDLPTGAASLWGASPGEAPPTGASSL